MAPKMVQHVTREAPRAEKRDTHFEENWITFWANAAAIFGPKVDKNWNENGSTIKSGHGWSKTKVLYGAGSGAGANRVT